MCCTSDEQMLAQIRRRTEPFYAWKKLAFDGTALLYPEYQYRPGWNSPTGTRGLHVFRYCRKNRKSEGLPIVRVRIHPRAVHGAESTRVWGRAAQLEVDRLFISKADWRKAGLP